MSAPAAAPADAAPKKKGKLPIILALALVLGGGGFFMMKPKGKKEEKKPTLVLAEHETEMEEFLTNTADPSKYVHTKLSVRLTKEYTEEKFKSNMGDARDAVLSVLNATPPADLTDVTKRTELKHKIAEAMNTALEGEIVDEGGEGEGDDHEKEHKPHRKGKETEKPTEEAASEWDSKTGPVLQVRFSDLATQ